MGFNYTGERKNIYVIKTTTNNELIIETRRLTKNILCIRQDDAIGHYDRTIKPHAILNRRQFGISETVCQLYIKARNNMKYKNKIVSRV